MQANPVVILTREPEDNLELAGKLQPLGLEVIDYPCIRTFLLPFGELSHLPGNQVLADFDIFVFTSKRGVAGMASETRFFSNPPITIAVVGQATAEAVEKTFGRPADIVADPSTGEGLAKTLVQQFKINSPHASSLEKNSPLPKILHIRGNKALNTFKNLMELYRFEVTELEVYRNESPELSDIYPIEIRERAIVVFASPSAVEYFFKINKTDRIKRDWTYLAIGRTTGAYLKTLEVEKIIESPAPRIEEIVQLIEIETK